MGYVTLKLTSTLDDIQVVMPVMEDAAFVVMNDAIQGVTEEIRDLINVEGEPVEYPIQWDSEKQRRAYFATNGFGAGIPYVRTGGEGHAFLSVGYVQQPLASWSVYSQSPISFYVRGNVLGEGQSRIHQGRWEKFQVAVDYVWTNFKNDINGLKQDMIHAMNVARGRQ